MLMFVYAGTFPVKSGLAQMAKGGVVMDVTNAEQARIAEEAGVSTTIKCFWYYTDIDMPVDMVHCTSYSHRSKYKTKTEW